MKWRKGNWWWVSLTVVTALLVMVGFGGARLTKVSWQSAQSYFGRVTLEQIVRENASVSTKEIAQQMRVYQLSVKPLKLALVDFHSPQLCGRNGCLYAVYQKLESEGSWVRVLSRYLDPYLPKSIPLLEESKLRDSCWNINQLEQTNLRQTTVCFGEGRSQVLETRLFQLN